MKENVIFIKFHLPWVLCAFFKHLQQLKFYYVESFYKITYFTDSMLI